MFDSLVKIANLTPRLRVGDPVYNAEQCALLAQGACENGASVLVFPELSISSATAGDLFFQSAFLNACETAVSVYIEKSAHLDAVSFIGAPVSCYGKLYNATLAICRGEILGASLKSEPSREESRYFAPAPRERVTVSYLGELVDMSDCLIYESTNLECLKIFVCPNTSLLSNTAILSRASASGATLIVSPSDCCEEIGKSELVKSAVSSQSYINKCAIACCAPSVYESTTDFVYSGRAYTSILGNIVSEKKPFSNEEQLYATLDLETVLHERKEDPCFFCEPDSDFIYIPFATELKETEIDSFPRSPFVPSDLSERESVCAMTLKMQAEALARRFTASRSEKMVIGVSGGLDSTLALIVCAEACDILGIARDNIIAVTMPCFGTTSRTKSNAQKLSESLGASFRTVDIKNSVLSHFEDISHPSDKYDVVYENAQARERTQVLMDMANSVSGIVVGTGDLSELALGFATYNGDHMSSYGVNAGVPKTLLRSLVSYYANISKEETGKVLCDILATPVSPELLPSQDGEISQCTEGIVGPYELHDFFLYYMLRYGFSPRKIKRLALAAFDGEYDGKTVDAWLRVFIRRFVTQQFKRSALPDGVKLGAVSLSPRGAFKMPSDAYCNFLLSELDGEF